MSADKFSRSQKSCRPRVIQGSCASVCLFWPSLQGGDQPPFHLVPFLWLEKRPHAADAMHLSKVSWDPMHCVCVRLSPPWILRLVLRKHDVCFEGGLRPCSACVCFFRLLTSYDWRDVMHVRWVVETLPSYRRVPENLRSAHAWS